jgi:hypothetical protein
MGRNRISSLDILQNDYEYCTISYYEEGIRNDIGEPIRNIIERATNVKCTINPMARAPKYMSLTENYEIATQGIVEKTTHHIILSAEQELNAGDIITNCDGDKYDVLISVNWQTHREAFLRKVT